MKDHTDASGMHGITFNNLRIKLEDVEHELQKEKHENSSIKVGMKT